MTSGRGDATALARAVRERTVTARALTAAALERIATRDRRLNAFTSVLAERAMAGAARVDAVVAGGGDPGPLAGVPFAAKNLFDVEGLPTLAGSRINRERPPARRDAAAVRALTRAGAVLVGVLNMDEYAYGFTTENTHYGPTRNPHDAARTAGGSSGGSAAAVAGGLVPLSLGSDTNGSIRVPAALCGVFGLKPTYGRVSRAGLALLAPSLDHVGPLAGTVRDLALAFDALRDPDAEDAVARAAPAESALDAVGKDVDGLRLAVADGYFARGGTPEARAAVERVAAALGVTRTVVVPDSDRARAAATLITAGEGSAEHLADLRARAKDFDPLTRDRFLAGALLPAAIYVEAQRFRGWYRERLGEIMRDVDVLLAPTTPFVAPVLGEERTTVDGVEVLTRRHLGVYTAPFSFVGVPVLSVPVARGGALPLGVQLVGRPFTETALFRVAAALEARGVAAASIVD